jgi:hypothetical protein
MKSILRLPLAGCLRIAANVIGLGEVAVTKSSIKKQMFK